MTATRSKTFLLANPEGRVLEWIARRLPRWVMPDHLTALGVLAAIGIAAAYALSNRDPVWLWAASGLLVVHWLGDSLDGTLARVRRTERPRYGYYLDHLVDAVATAFIGIGLGLSPHMLLACGLVIVVAYLVLSINTYLETSTLGVFSLGYGRLGPTEARIDEGLQAARTIRAELPGMGVLMLSQYVEERYVTALLEHGAAGVGYLLKDRVAEIERFTDAIRQVAEGGSVLDPEVVTHMLGRRGDGGPLERLTEREGEVLQLMAEGKTNRAISQQLYMSERAVERHVTGIFTKLELPVTDQDHRRVLAVLAYVKGT